MFETFHQSSSTNSKPTFYNPFKVKQRRRTTKQQYKILEEVFQTNQKPNAAIRKELATKLGMTPRGVQVRHPIFFYSSVCAYTNNIR
ncbi:MAG: homeobox domain-containing protein [Paracoccaceae bacterium]